MRRPPGPLGDVVLKVEEYRLIRELFGERIGVYFGPEARGSIERRLRERLLARGHQSFLEYYQFLKWSPQAGDEWQAAVELLTTHETYFFREAYQLRAFQEEVLPIFAQRNHAERRLGIWSAGCSTGEEVYTLALIVLESRLFEGWDVRVYGSDISRRCVAAARRGIYGPSAFRTTSDERRRAFVAPAEAAVGETPSQPPRSQEPLSVIEPVRAMCHFGQMNLLDEEKTRLVGKVDVAFCRNVLIYLDLAARRRVIDILYDRLVGGGILLLGHSESLLNVSTAFELLHLKDDLVYKKPSVKYPNRGGSPSP